MGITLIVISFLTVDLQWVNTVKYLGMHILAGGVQKVDTTNAKRKYCGCFNSILSVCGNNRNELVSLHLVKSYWLPHLLYGCEGISFSVLQIHELNFIWNNVFAVFLIAAGVNL